MHRNANILCANIRFYITKTNYKKFLSLALLLVAEYWILWIKITDNVVRFKKQDQNKIVTKKYNSINIIYQLTNDNFRTTGKCQLWNGWSFLYEK